MTNSNFHILPEENEFCSHEDHCFTLWSKVPELCILHYRCHMQSKSNLMWRTSWNILPFLNTNVRICRNCEWTFTTNCEPPTDALKYKTGGERKKEKRWICFPTKQLSSLTEETKEKTLCEEAKSCINYSIFRCYKHNFDKHSKLWKNCTVNAIKSFFLVQHHQCMCLLRIYCGLYSAVILWLMIQDDH